MSSGPEIIFRFQGQTPRNLANFIKDRPSLKVIRIDAHVSMKGSFAKVLSNKKLVQRSRKRAQGLLRRLVTEGVEPRRLKVRAVGGAEPLSNVDSSSGAKRNTFIDYRILTRD